MQIYKFGMIFNYELLLQFNLYIFTFNFLQQMNTRFIILFIFTIGITSFCLAAAPPPPHGGAGCWPPPCVPIDGGISLLIAAGAIYGGKKLYSKRKKDSL
jgi:hypothetical protein